MSAEQPDDDLWHAAGEEDSFVRRLEWLLARYRFTPPQRPDIESLDDGPETSSRDSTGRCR